jgi:hypothetical protein
MYRYPLVPGTQLFHCKLLYIPRVLQCPLLGYSCAAKWALFKLHLVADENWWHSATPETSEDPKLLAATGTIMNHVNSRYMMKLTRVYQAGSTGRTWFMHLTGRIKDKHVKCCQILPNVSQAFEDVWSHIVSHRQRIQSAGEDGEDGEDGEGEWRLMKGMLHNVAQCCTHGSTWMIRRAYPQAPWTQPESATHCFPWKSLKSQLFCRLFPTHVAYCCFLETFDLDIILAWSKASTVFRKIPKGWSSGSRLQGQSRSLSCNYTLHWVQFHENQNHRAQ